MNLIPDAPTSTPDYWCTWNTQNFSAVVEDGADTTGDAGACIARDNLNGEIVFGQPGWATCFYDKIRRDLFFILDDGWDVPYGANPGKARELFGSCELSSDRFPMFSGSPAQRLRTLNDRLLENGWKGAGLWISAQAAGERDGKTLLADDGIAAYWRERAGWCHDAGIGYWKVDWGVRASSAAFRSMLTETAAAEAPGLLVEHALCMVPMNGIEDGNWRTGEEYRTSMRAMLEVSPLFRAYDVLNFMSEASMLDRLSVILRETDAVGGPECLINCEDELYIGAALGLAVGIMRHPLGKLEPWLSSELDPRHNRIDEAIRTVRWHRIAPAFIAHDGNLAISEERLTDSWEFKPKQTWWKEVWNRTTCQTAPAVISRGLALPEVTASGEKPFVVASRNPNGAISVAMLPRTLAGQEHKVHFPADIRLDAGDGQNPIGVFGRCSSLTLSFSEPVSGKRLWMQDLAGDAAVDITDRVQWVNNNLRLDGTLLAEIGLSAATPGDLSEPGLVLVFA